MDALLWIMLPGFTAVAAGMLAWFIMQSRMEVALAQQRERLAETRGALDAERKALESTLDISLQAAEANMEAAATSGDDRAAAKADAEFHEARLETDIEYTRLNGVSLRMDASIPAGAEKCPSVIIVHGGAYRQTATLELDVRDSDTSWQAAPGGPTRSARCRY